MSVKTKITRADLPRPRPAQPQLTPYDTGERAQPHTWPVDPTDRDSYGLVDFDDDEGSTVATVVVRRDESGGYVLEVTGHGPDLTIKDCGVL